MRRSAFAIQLVTAHGAGSRSPAVNVSSVTRPPEMVFVGAMQPVETQESGL
jgi:hypothetical protein